MEYFRQWKCVMSSFFLNIIITITEENWSSKVCRKGKVQLRDNKLIKNSPRDAIVHSIVRVQRRMARIRNTWLFALLRMAKRNAMPIRNYCYYTLNMDFILVICAVEIAAEETNVIIAIFTNEKYARSRHLKPTLFHCKTNYQIFISITLICEQRTTLINLFLSFRRNATHCDID